MDEPKLLKSESNDRHFDNCPSESGTLEESVKGQLVTSRYSEYMSYPPRDNQDIAIPTWELTDHVLEKLDKAYIIAKDFSSDEMKQKIKNLMYPIIDQVLEGRGFCFRIPNKAVDEMEYNSDVCFPLLKRGKEVNRNFYYGTCTHTAAMTAWALKAIFDNLDSELVVTLRDLFYRRSHLFQTQVASDGIVTDICFMFGCTRRSLNLTSEEKGWVCGKMSIHLKDGRILDCSHKTHIPDESKIKSCTFDQDPKYILVLEKGTIFNYLERLEFHETKKCIIMTSNGSPDISSRRFLKWLQKETKLPIIGVADADPSGLEIMRYYSQGSVNLAQENFNLAVPSLMWVGISLFDIEELGIELNEYNSKKLTEKDVKILDNLLTDKYTKLTPRWKAAVEKMRAVDRKASFEMMHEQGYRYVADCLLPKLINRAMGIKEQATPQ